MILALMIGAATGLLVGRVALGLDPIPEHDATTHPLIVVSIAGALGAAMPTVIRKIIWMIVR